MSSADHTESPEQTSAAAPAAASPWASPLGRWLRGLVLDGSSDLPSLAEVIAPVRDELQRAGRLGVLFVRLGHWGRLTDVYSWRELEEIYRSASRVTLGSLGSGLRQVDLPADVGFHGEGFAVVLAGPRQNASVDLEVVDRVAERLAAAIRTHLADSLVARVHERLSVAVGAALLENPEGDETLEDVVVGSLVAADTAARCRQQEQEQELAAELRRLLEDEGVTPIYRPLVDLGRGSVAGWEAGMNGPSYRNLHLEDVLLDVARRGGLEHKVLDAYQAALLADEGLGDREGGFLVVRAGSSELLESAVRVNSLLYQRGRARLSASDIIFLVDAAEVLRHFPTSLVSFRSVAELGFGLALDLRPDCPLPLDHIRQLEPGFLRLSGRSVQGIHRKQDEFDLLLLLARFAARHGIKVLTGDCSDRNELLVLQRAGVDYVSGDYLAPGDTRPLRPVVQLP